MNASGSPNQNSGKNPIKQPIKKPIKKPSQKLLREVLCAARQARSRMITEDRPPRLRQVYAICFELARDLQGRFSHLQIMVGDLVNEQGPVQHHWIEIPLGEVRAEEQVNAIYIDAACDSLDPFQPVRVGITDEPDFVASHRNGLAANIDIQDPRNRPDVLYKVKSAWDPESL